MQSDTRTSADMCLCSKYVTSTLFLLAFFFSAVLACPQDASISILSPMQGAIVTDSAPVLDFFSSFPEDEHLSGDNRVLRLFLP